jgi:hypothetical protein
VVRQHGHLDASTGKRQLERLDDERLDDGPMTPMAESPKVTDWH